MKTTCCACDPRVCAVALGRWALGTLFLFAGIGKLPNVAAFVKNYLAPPFEKTWLPSWLVVPFGYVLPFAEVILGALLLLGIARNATLFATGLLLIALAFGEMVLQQPGVVFNNLGFLFMTAAVLFLGEYDRWVVPWGQGKPTPLESGNAI